jgi:hypothetical protein
MAFTRVGDPVSGYYTDVLKRCGVLYCVPGNELGSFDQADVPDGDLAEASGSMTGGFFSSLEFGTLLWFCGLSAEPRSCPMGARPGEDARCLSHDPDRGSSMLIEGSCFDTRTLANMNVALDRVCGKTTTGEQHEVRKRIAQAIVRCAKSGRTTLGALTEAGEKALCRLPEKAA